MEPPCEHPPCPLPSNMLACTVDGTCQAPGRHSLCRAGLPNPYISSPCSPKGHERQAQKGAPGKKRHCIILIGCFGLQEVSPRLAEGSGADSNQRGLRGIQASKIIGLDSRNPNFRWGSCSPPPPHCSCPAPQLHHGPLGRWTQHPAGWRVLGSLPAYPVPL